MTEERRVDTTVTQQHSHCVNWPFAVFHKQRGPISSQCHFHKKLGCCWGTVQCLYFLVPSCICVWLITQLLVVIYGLAHAIAILYIEIGTSMYTVSQKSNQNYFCYNYVKLPPNLTIFGIKMANSLKLYEVYSFSTSLNICQCTTMLKGDVPNYHITL